MSTKLFTGNVALITGGTGGIGTATCHALAELGCDIAVHYNAAAEKADNLSTTLVEQYGVNSKAFWADFSEFDTPNAQVKSLHSRVSHEMGPPSVLFNNAGLTRKTNVKDISEISIEDFEYTWRANCGSAFLLTQLCLPDMIQKGWGRLVFCSSVAAFTGGVVGPHYASSKSALHGLIHWLSSAYCSKGITANGVAPALIQDTAMLPGNNGELATSK
ncbi:MAG: hypothetical protein M1828_000369 [Chrysothrix sp. TS-e1954]|nr:MAG: hypothetical protein M1828_000369 [Chrysothrix sp. TS-e1954]